MAEVICVTNHKGGIGKTTTVLALGPILQEMGYKVLTIDVDMQCNTTDVFGAISEDVATIYDIMIERSANTEETIQHTDFGDIIPGDRLLSTADVNLYADIVEGLTRIKTAIKSVQDKYDYIIMDTNPTTSRVLINALVASDKVVIPISADRFGLVGLSQVIDTINAVQSGPNPNLKIAGILLEKYKSNLRLERDVKRDIEQIAEQLGIPVFKTTIRESIAVREAQTLKIPLSKYSPKNNSTKDYRGFAKELIAMEV